MNIIKVEKYVGSMPNNHQAVLELMDKHWREFMDSMLMTEDFIVFLDYLCDLLKQRITNGSTNASLPVISQALDSFYQIAKIYEESVHTLEGDSQAQFNHFFIGEYNRFLEVVTGRFSEVLPYEL
jgi:hypothetical protein